MRYMTLAVVGGQLLGVRIQRSTPRRCGREEGPVQAREVRAPGCGRPSMDTTPSGLSRQSQSCRVDSAVLIQSHDVISQHVEVLERERTLVGLPVGAQGIGLGLSEITSQSESVRGEVPAHMEQPDRPGSAFLPGALAHRPDLQICRLELVTIRVPGVEGFPRRYAA